MYDESKENEKEEQTQRQSTQENLSKTENVYRLLKTPQQNRDDVWVKQFLDNLPGASFKAGDPQVIVGPDGFPYFQLFLPREGERFESFVIENMKDDFLLHEGLGVVINPTDQQPDWVLTYGDILNLHLNKTFYTEDDLFNKEKGDEDLPKNAQVVTGVPSETMLPNVARNVLKEFFKQRGFHSPKVLLLMKQYYGRTSQDLAFNITPKNFANRQDFNTFMQVLGWFFPRHYSYVGIDEDGGFRGKFVDL